MTPLPILPPLPPRPLPLDGQTDAALRTAAIQLEATFLAEMLKAAGFGDSRTTFGGGVGEDQFASFMLEAQALDLAEAGGIGLAQALFEALKVQLDA